MINHVSNMLTLLTIVTQVENIKICLDESDAAVAIPARATGQQREKLEAVSDPRPKVRGEPLADAMGLCRNQRRGSSSIGVL